MAKIEESSQNFQMIFDEVHIDDIPDIENLRGYILIKRKFPFDIVKYYGGTISEIENKIETSEIYITIENVRTFENFDFFGLNKKANQSENEKILFEAMKDDYIRHYKNTIILEAKLMVGPSYSINGRYHSIKFQLK